MLHGRHVAPHLPGLLAAPLIEQPLVFPALKQELDVQSGSQQRTRISHIKLVSGYSGEHHVQIHVFLLLLRHNVQQSSETAILDSQNDSILGAQQNKDPLFAQFFQPHQRKEAEVGHPQAPFWHAVRPQDTAPQEIPAHRHFSYRQ